jgi:ubiquinone biosynthesis protein
MFDRHELRGLIPTCYAAYEPLVTLAFQFFIEHLSPRRLEAVFTAQASLPGDADLSTRVVHFLHACPALHKLGQVIARDRRLDPTLRNRLQRLEMLEPHTPMDAIRPILYRQLSPQIDRYRIEIAAASLAEASVAVVVPCTWIDPDSADRSRAHAVLKILKPGVETDLQEDLEILARLADQLDDDKAHGRIPAVDYRDIFDEVRALLLHEVQVEQEQANLLAAAKRYDARRDVFVPHLLPFSTAHVTGMQRVFGVKVTDLCHDSPHRELADIIARRLVADVLFSPEPVAWFHADPHAGNLFAADDGRLAILDWSLVGQIHHEQLAGMAQLAAAAMMRNPQAMARAVEQLTVDAPRRNALAREIDAALLQLAPLSWPGPRWVMQLLDSIALAGVRFPPNLLLLRKAYFTLEGVVSDVSPGSSLDRMLLRASIERFLVDGAMRPFIPLHSRDLPTHLSTADLMHLTATVPMALARMGMQTFGGWLTALASAALTPSPRRT